MKKLIIKIGNETHELPYNGEAYSVEVSDKYIPKVGDCVKVECDNTYVYSFKVKEITKLISNVMAKFSLSVGDNFKISKNGFVYFNNRQIFTQITTEELKAKYAEAGYDWDYESDTIKPLKWTPKDGDDVWWVSSSLEPISLIFYKNDEILQSMIEKGFLFKTREECQEFSNYCLSYFKK